MAYIPPKIERFDHESKAWTELYGHGCDTAEAAQGYCNKFNPKGGYLRFVPNEAALTIEDVLKRSKNR